MKRQTTILLGIIVATMSSCVYSLFPIYTKDTLIFKKELLGKWAVNEDSYLLFETTKEGEAEVTETSEYKYTIEIKEGFTMSSDEPIFIEYNGRNIYDEDSIKMILNKRILEKEVTEDDAKITKMDADPATFEKLFDPKKIIKEQIKEDKLSPRDIEYKGSVTVFEEKSYKMTVVENEVRKEAYIAHLVQIGNDLFMDLYPVKEYDSKNISDNFFPVHTFYKVKVTESEFTMIHFDLDKLNKLFESNLIRLRHENVEGTVLITAQPEELQKFIEKYAEDESVFESVETYKKAS